MPERSVAVVSEPADIFLLERRCGKGNGVVS